MKHLALLSLSAGLLAVGCTSNDKTSAGLEREPNAPPPSAVTAESRPQSSSHGDSAANGGFNLPASAPYQGTATVTQNVNPAPFLAASQAQATTPSTTTTQTKQAAKKQAARRKK